MTPEQHIQIYIEAGREIFADIKAQPGVARPIDRKALAHHIALIGADMHGELLAGLTGNVSYVTEPRLERIAFEMNQAYNKIYTTT